MIRRAERVAVRTLTDPADAIILVFLNRSSDLLFTLARLANYSAGVAETEWVNEQRR